MDDFELGFDITGEFSPTYAPTYASNDNACMDALDRADASSDDFVSDIRDYFDTDSQTTFGDLFESGADAWSDDTRAEEVCDTGGFF